MSKPLSTQQQYDRQRKRVARMSAWLTGPQGKALSEPEWNQRFTSYEEALRELRRLGDLLRPQDEVSEELFAA